MKPSVVIGAVIGVFVIIIAGFTLIGGDSQDNGDQAGPVDLAALNLSSPLSVELSTTTADGETSSGSIQIDADGNSRTVISAPDGSENRTLGIGDDAFIFNPEADNWTKFAGGNTDAGAGTLSEEDLQELAAANLKDKGTGNCSIGTCRIFEGTVDGEQTTIKIDVANNRLIAAEVSTEAGETASLLYNYEPVDQVLAPDSFDEL